MLLSCTVGTGSADWLRQEDSGLRNPTRETERRTPDEETRSNTNQPTPAISFFDFRGSEFSRPGEGPTYGGCLHFYAKWPPEQQPGKMPIRQKRTAIPETSNSEIDFGLLPLRSPRLAVMRSISNSVPPAHPERGSFPPCFYCTVDNREFRLSSTRVCERWTVCEDTRTCVSDLTPLCPCCLLLKMEVAPGSGEQSAGRRHPPEPTGNTSNTPAGGDSTVSPSSGILLHTQLLAIAKQSEH